MTALNNFSNVLGVLERSSRTATGGSPRLALFIAFLATAAVIGLAPPEASAATPVWRVSMQSVPTYLAPGGSGEYQLYVTNVSEIASSGVVTVTDTLPPGVTATAAGDVAESFEPNALADIFWHCTGSTIVTCTSDPAMLSSITQDDFHGFGADSFLLENGIAGSAPPIGIQVNVDGSVSGTVTNTVQVSGGKALSTTTLSVPVTVSSAPAPGGLGNLVMTMLNKDGTPDVQAGSHPYEMTTSFTINDRTPATNTAEDPKDLEVDLPVGLVGNAQVVPQCPRDEFDAGISGSSGDANCPDDTQIGTEVFTLSHPNFSLVMPVYNLTHPGNVPAEFGFGVIHHRGIIDAGLRTGEGYGLKVNLGNIEKIHFVSSSLTIWGEPADPSHNADRCYFGNGCGQPTDLPRLPFLTLPTTCGSPLTRG